MSVLFWEGDDSASDISIRSANGMDDLHQDAERGWSLIPIRPVRSVHLGQLVEPVMGYGNTPVTFTQLLEEWLIYVTLFSGLATLLGELMNLACSICEPSFLFSAF